MPDRRKRIARAMPERALRRAGDTEPGKRVARAIPDRATPSRASASRGRYRGEHVLG